MKLVLTYLLMVLPAISMTVKQEQDLSKQGFEGF